jgi:hypothetical protein
MNIASSISDASKTLTPVSENIRTQGPGGEAYELAPNPSGVNRQNLKLPLEKKLEKKLEKTTAKVGRRIAKAGAVLIEPIVDHPRLAALFALGITSVAGAILVGRAARAAASRA